MTQCDRSLTGLNRRGRGTGNTPFLSPTRIKSKEEKERELIGGYTETAPLAVPRPLPDCPTGLAKYLAANPAMTVRDWKGKGFSIYSPFDPTYEAPGEVPWQKLDRNEVRRRATATKARFLPRNIRMAAAHDTGLVWDDRSREYRLKTDAHPEPATAISGRGHES